MNSYNTTSYCGWHKQADVEAYLKAAAAQDIRSRELRSFVKEFHKAGVAGNMFNEARISNKERFRESAVKLKNYHEALGVLKVSSMVFRLSMPTLLRISSTNKNMKVARSVMAYVMSTDLEMSANDIATFFGYTYVPAVTELVTKIKNALLDDEDIICAVDLVREEYFRISQYDD